MLNPDAKTELQLNEHELNLSTVGYMKLIDREEPTSDRYSKTVRTEMDGLNGKISL